ncbi:hyalin-like isoform X3 [Chrysemys picta bellii]|uniref:hyalin-like isoform X3 n=1 Tax=Chrysemys picta bellii TaxID=8478 RepID=UPI0032B12EE9
MNCEDNQKKSPEIYTAHVEGRGATAMKIKWPKKSKQPDTIPPTITNCPWDITITTKTDPVQVSWEQPEISDNSGVFTSVASISSGSCFRYGTHQVQYTAHDEAGNEASCQFKVTIQKPDLSCTAQPPTDGSLACGMLSYPGSGMNKWQFCVPFCMKSTGFHRRAWSVFFCQSSQSGTSWFHLDEAWQMTKAHMPETCTDTEPPVVISCPQNIEIETKKGNLYWNDLPEFSWKEPVFEDNSRGPLTITKGGSNVNNGDKLAYGQYSVEYIATDLSGNQAKCSFEISVKSIACTMELPEHGAIVCGYPSMDGMDLMTIDCIVLCQSKYQFSRDPYPIYACSEEGLWWTFTSTFTPIGPNLPSLNHKCQEPDIHKKPKVVDQNFYFDGDCHDRAVQVMLIGHLEYFQRKTSAYQYCELNREFCRKWNGYRNVTVFCGST